MKLGVKVLLLTLSLTLGLAGTIIWLVTTRVTARERELAQREVARVVAESLARIDLEIDRIDRVVRLLLEEPQSRALLERLFSGRARTRDEFAEAQIREEIFGRNLQSEAFIGGSPPSFHLLVDSDGIPLIASSGDPSLRGALEEPDRRWPVAGILRGAARRGRYLWLDRRLYVALGVPLRLDVGEAPTHVYFVGAEVSSGWIDHLIGAKGDAIALRAWFLVDGAIVARGGGSPSRGPGVDAAAARAISDAASRAGSEYERAEIAFEGWGDRWIGVAMRFEPAPGSRGAYVLASSLDDALASLRALQRNIGVFALLVTGVCIVACMRLARSIARPVERLATASARIAKGEFGVKVDARGRDELATLARSFNQMAMGLEQRDLIKDTFGKFVDPRVVEGLLADPERLKPGGEVRDQSVLFADLEGFTGLAERLTPEALVRLLNEYLGAAADAVALESGIVDKFIGDAVVAFWGPPLTDDHAARACKTALRIGAIVDAMAPACAAAGCPPLRARVGIATGETLVGNIGSASKFNYTVMGDVVNLGSRLEGLNKQYGTGTLATDRTARDAARSLVFRWVDTVRVLGRTEAVDVFEIVRAAGEPPVENEDAWLEAIGRAREAYVRADWATAARAFAAAVAARPGDAASEVMRERCVRFGREGPPGEWDGAWAHESK